MSASAKSRNPLQLPFTLGVVGILSAFCTAGVLAFAPEETSLAATLSAATCMALLAAAIAGHRGLKTIVRRDTFVSEGLDASTAAIAVYDDDDYLVFANKSYERILQVPPDTLHPGRHYRDITRRSLSRTLEGERLDAEVERRFTVHKIADGTPNDRMYANGSWIRVTKTRTRSGGNIGVAMDVTETYKAHGALKEEAARFEALAENVPAGICQVDGQGRILTTNAAFRALILEAANHGPNMQILIDDEPQSSLSAALTLLAPRHQESALTMRYPATERRFIVRKARLSNLAVEGKADSLLLFVDITEREKAEARIRYYAHHDPLTGALNRLSFSDELEKIAHMRATDTDLALIAIDLDDFKPVNDQLGHHAGDEVLRQAVIRMRKVLGAGARLFRVGGDEFAVITELTADDDPIAIAMNLLEAITEPAEIEDTEIKVGASIGISRLTANVGSPEILMQQADNALYQVKTNGGAGVMMFDTDEAATQNLSRTTRQRPSSATPPRGPHDPPRASRA